MCGITGAYQLKSTGKPVDFGLLEAVECMAHRGPDDQGIHVKGKAALGHRRLSILDTSTAGHQPFTDQNGRHTIIYNGEIFNFPALRRQLEDQGHVFRSKTDTEVILRMFILKGPSFLHELNGFFTLAIHDAETDELFIARDRFGVKPVFWAIHEDRLIFGS
ncbi:MAG: asparagine synthetase B, partial [Bacteroidota bacterium]|nr:asparagine synthetase B [Bacteroidota bacterium]